MPWIAARHRVWRVALALLLALPLLTGTGGPSLSGARQVRAATALPTHFGIGLAAQPTSTDLDGWLPDSGLPWDYAYQYLAAGVNTGSGWEGWNERGQFPLRYARAAHAHGYIPTFSYYEMYQSNGSCTGCGEVQKDLSNLNNPTTMAAYYANFTLLMRRLGPGTYDTIAGYGDTAIVHIEPDLSGYAQQATLNNGNCYRYCTGTGNDPALLNAAVASSGVTEVAAYPNTYQGFNWALLHLRVVASARPLRAQCAHRHPHQRLDHRRRYRQRHPHRSRCGGARHAGGTVRRAQRRDERPQRHLHLRLHLQRYRRP